MKIKFTIEYDGTKFFGWQSQCNLVTVQETVERAVAKVLNLESVELYGAGRTDTGVHALGQVAHIELLDEVIIKKWCENVNKMATAVNFYLHDSNVVVRSTELVDDQFHARFSAKQRSYVYIIFNRNMESVLLRNRVWHINKPLDLDLMQQASKLFLGTHNFNAFRSADCQAKNPIRSIDSIEIERKSEFITINISAKSFLHNQVRIIVGTLKQIGLGKMSPDIVLELLISGDRTQAGPTAPPFGLYFKEVKY